MNYTNLNVLLRYTLYNVLSGDLDLLRWIPTVLFYYYNYYYQVEKWQFLFCFNSVLKETSI